MSAAPGIDAACNLTRAWRAVFRVSLACLPVLPARTCFDRAMVDQHPSQTRTRHGQAKYSLFTPVLSNSQCHAPVTPLPARLPPLPLVLRSHNL